jgi:hypothetical protein
MQCAVDGQIRPATWSMCNVAEMPSAPLITTYQDLRAALAARRKELKLSQIDLDGVALLAGGHVGKIECGSKRLGDISLAAILGALGAALILVPADSAQAKGHSETWAQALKRQKEERKKRGAKAQASWLAKTTPAQRRAWARKAARVRWAGRQAHRRGGGRDARPAAEDCIGVAQK